MTDRTDEIKITTAASYPSLTGREVLRHDPTENGVIFQDFACQVFAVAFLAQAETLHNVPAAMPSHLITLNKAWALNGPASVACGAER